MLSFAMWNDWTAALCWPARGAWFFALVCRQKGDSEIRDQQFSQNDMVMPRAPIRLPAKLLRIGSIPVKSPVLVVLKL
jgi:hypothetical protein